MVSICRPKGAILKPLCPIFCHEIRIVQESENSLPKLENSRKEQKGRNINFEILLKVIILGKNGPILFVRR
jgi:hypothetical protein